MRILTVEEIKEILKNHALWIEDNDKGECADFSEVDFTETDFNFSGLDLRWANFQYAVLQGADFQYAVLQSANLRFADLRGANLYRANLQYADLQAANLQSADLINATLQNASLRYADLQGANIDYSCLPLKCGGLKWKIDKRLAVQLTYHLCSMECDDKKFIALRNTMLDFANEFHHIGYGCPELKPIEYSPPTQ
jgi:hypothetical protein